ncbi:hypothetical protein SAMN02745664_1205 [Moraxella cuniculi DSM 21768]|uniref:Uncharacterized protein n=1 Tax=Moraxella cuniculi DSM 21768 TaxID=1122245 RepID=A0A1N7FYQ4_9GAMM|nr:hypothetical protein [Moraxella cuniculi]OOS04195.1 hypothetical protein B0189_08745 [Moraxella cuniculi]SIS05459.1 hypothetical protein SAMN02745664_1205 [Moraxella cuniculi DSM 21768]
MNNWKDLSKNTGLALGMLDNLKVEQDILQFYATFDNCKKLIIFDGFFSFRFLFESYAFNILNHHRLDGISWLFESSQTEYSQWFDTQSEKIYNKEYSHYRLVFLNHIVDVLSQKPPLIFNR